MSTIYHIPVVHFMQWAVKIRFQQNESIAGNRDEGWNAKFTAKERENSSKKKVINSFACGQNYFHLNTPASISWIKNSLGVLCGFEKLSTETICTHKFQLKFFNYNLEMENL